MSASDNFLLWNYNRHLLNLLTTKVNVLLGCMYKSSTTARYYKTSKLLVGKTNFVFKRKDMIKRYQLIE